MLWSIVFLGFLLSLFSRSLIHNGVVAVFAAAFVSTTLSKFWIELYFSLLRPPVAGERFVSLLALMVFSTLGAVIGVWAFERRQVRMAK